MEIDEWFCYLPRNKKFQRQCPKLYSKGSSLNLRLYEYVKLHGPDYGLHLNDSETVLWWPNMSLDSLSIFPQSLQRASDGVVFLGSPIGSSDFGTSSINKRISKMEDKLAVATKLDNEGSYWVCIIDQLVCPCSLIIKKRHEKIPSCYPLLFYQECQWWHSHNSCDNSFEM